MWCSPISSRTADHIEKLNSHSYIENGSESSLIGRTSSKADECLQVQVVTPEIVADPLLVLAVIVGLPPRSSIFLTL